MKIANRKIAIMLVSMVSLPIIQSTNAASLNTQERAYLEQLITNACVHAGALSKQLHAFFDTDGNTESYGTHVQKFKKILESVDNTIIYPLMDTIKETTNPEYKLLLEQMLAMIVDLRENLFDAYETFKKNEGSNYLFVAQALGALKEKVSKRLPSLEKQINQLHANLKNYDAELAQAIANLPKTLSKSFELGLSDMKVVTRVKKRMQCRNTKAG